MKTTILLNTKAKLVLILLLTLPIIQHCSSVYKSEVNKSPKIQAAPVSYQTQILPIMEQKCTPCHFPERGRKEMLNTYSSLKNNIDEVLRRIQLPISDEEFMPFKSKKTPLSGTEIKLFVNWKAQGMPK